MNKEAKKIIYLASIFVLLTTVFFFGLRLLLNAVESFKMPSLNGNSLSSSSSQAETTTTTQPIALGEEQEQDEEQPKKENSSISLSSLTKQPRSLNTKKLLGLALIIAAFFTYKAMINYEQTHGLDDLKGEERWAKRRELRKTYIECNEKDIAHLEKAGTPIAHYTNTYYIEPSVKHNLIIGTTGSGKTQTHVLQSIKLIAESADKQNFIINDPKGEILQDTYSILNKEGYRVVIFNLKDAEVSSGWNPLTFVINEYVRCRQENKDLSKVAEYVDTICYTLTHNDKSDPIWPSSAKSSLSAMILYLIETAYEFDERNKEAIVAGNIKSRLDKVTFYSAFKLFSIFGGEYTYRQEGEYTKKLNALDELFKQLPVSSLASAAYTTTRFADGEMRSSIWATVADNTTVFARDVGIAKITAHTEIDLDNLIENSDKPFAVYMLLPDDRPSRHILATMFIDQAYLSIIEYLSRNRIQALPRRINFILDEFANMPKISGMDNKITVSRSRNVQWWLYIQGLSQLEATYDKSAKTIRENCPNIIYIYSGDEDTNKYIEGLLGSSTLMYHTYSGKLSEEQSRSQSYEGKPLKNINQLRRLQMGETITISHRQRPVLSKFDFYYKLGVDKTDIDSVFADVPDFDLDKSLYPLTDFTVLLPAEFEEFRQRIASDPLYSEKTNEEAEPENRNTNTAPEEVIGGDAPDSSDGGGGGLAAYIGNRPSDEQPTVTAYNPMELQSSDGKQQEQVTDSLMAILGANHALNQTVSAEQIISKVDGYTGGSLSEAVNSGNFARARQEYRRLCAKNRLSADEEQILGSYIESQISNKAPADSARKI